MSIDLVGEACRPWRAASISSSIAIDATMISARNTKSFLSSQNEGIATTYRSATADAGNSVSKRRDRARSRPRRAPRKAAASRRCAYRDPISTTLERLREPGDRAPPPASTSPRSPIVAHQFRRRLLDDTARIASTIWPSGSAIAAPMSSSRTSSVPGRKSAQVLSEQLSPAPDRAVGRNNRARSSTLLRCARRSRNPRVERMYAMIASSRRSPPSLSDRAGDDAAERDDRDLRRAAADVDDHARRAGSRIGRPAPTAAAIACGTKYTRPAPGADERPRAPLSSRRRSPNPARRP